MTRITPRSGRSALFAACLFLCGCLSIPDEVKADLAPPDGKRANNFGLFVEVEPGTWKVRPYNPTIAPISTASDTEGGS